MNSPTTGDLLDRRDVLILDTETTGFRRDDQVIEIAVIDTTGAIRFNSLVMPKNRRVPQDAVAIHGISMDKLVAANAPPYNEIHPELDGLLSGAAGVWIYNAAFDIKLLDQTGKKYRLRSQQYKVGCMMKAYAEYRREPSPHGKGWKWHKLEDAVMWETNRPIEQTHRALDDCRLVLELMQCVDTPVRLVF